MQISDIRKELENIIILYQKYEDRDYNEFLKNEVYKTEWRPNSFIRLNDFQKELYAQRKGLKSESAKLWAKNLYIAVRNYNKSFTSHKEPNLVYKTLADESHLLTPMVSEDTTHYEVSKETPNSKEIVLKVPDNEILYKNAEIENLAVHIPTIKDKYLCVISVSDNIKELVETLLLCEKDTLQPLPKNYKFRKPQKHNLIIRSNSHHKDLLILSEDMNRMSEIIELLISLKADPKKGQVDDKYPTYSLRKLSTGTFEVFVTIYLPVALEITTFIFVVIDEIRKLKERQQNIKNKKRGPDLSQTTIISRCLDNAEKALAINPEDEYAKLVVKKCMINTLKYLKDNKSGSINGEEYNLPEISNSVLDELILEIEELTKNGDE